MERALRDVFIAFLIPREGMHAANRSRITSITEDPSGWIQDRQTRRNDIINKPGKPDPKIGVR